MWSGGGSSAEGTRIEAPTGWGLGRPIIEAPTGWSLGREAHNRSTDRVGPGEAHNRSTDRVGPGEAHKDFVMFSFEMVHFDAFWSTF